MVVRSDPIERTALDPPPGAVEPVLSRLHPASGDRRPAGGRAMTATGTPRPSSPEASTPNAKRSWPTRSGAPCWSCSTSSARPSGSPSSSTTCPPFPSTASPRSSNAPRRPPGNWPAAPAAVVPVLIDGDAGAMWAPGGSPRSVISFTIEGGRVTGIEFAADPASIDRFELIAFDDQRLSPRPGPARPRPPAAAARPRRGRCRRPRRSRRPARRTRSRPTTSCGRTGASGPRRCARW